MRGGGLLVGGLAVACAAQGAFWDDDPTLPARSPATIDFGYANDIPRGLAVARDGSAWIWGYSTRDGDVTKGGRPVLVRMSSRGQMLLRSDERAALDARLASMQYISTVVELSQGYFAIGGNCPSGTTTFRACVLVITADGEPASDHAAGALVTSSSPVLEATRLVALPGGLVASLAGPRLLLISTAGTVSEVQSLPSACVTSSLAASKSTGVLLTYTSYVDRTAGRAKLQLCELRGNTYPFSLVTRSLELPQALGPAVLTSLVRESDGSIHAVGYKARERMLSIGVPVYDPVYPIAVRFDATGALDTSLGSAGVVELIEYTGGFARSAISASTSEFVALVAYRTDGAQPTVCAPGETGLVRWTRRTAAGQASSAGWEEQASSLSNSTGYTGVVGGGLMPDGRAWVVFQYQRRINGCLGLPGATGNDFALGRLAGLMNMAADADGDGVPNGVELHNGTNPAVKDNDVFADARLFAMQQYRDFLNREGDDAGVSFWASQMGVGAQTRAQMVQTFINSPEFEATVSPVARLYFAYFRRIPDFGGLNFWIGQYLGGSSLESISNAFAASAEFGATYGSLGNSQFVSLVYQNVLGRPPDAAGLAFWQAQIESGAASRGPLMVAFSESAEYRVTISAEVYVTMLYMAMLRRAPDPAGFDSWVRSLDQGNTAAALIEAFLAAPEYRGRFLP